MRRVNENTQALSDNVSDREKLATRKMMEGLARAASAIEDAKGWSDELQEKDWYQDQFGFDTAAHGICKQLMCSYTSLCEAWKIPVPSDLEAE